MFKGKIDLRQGVLGRMGKGGRLLTLWSVFYNIVGYQLTLGFWHWVCLASALLSAGLLVHDLHRMLYWTRRWKNESIPIDIVVDWWHYSWRLGYSVRALKKMAAVSEQRREANARHEENEKSPRRRVMEEAERVKANDAVCAAALDRLARKGYAGALLFLRCYEDCHPLMNRATAAGVLEQAVELVCQAVGPEMHHKLRVLVDEAERSERERNDLIEQAAALGVTPEVADALSGGDVAKARAIVKQARGAAPAPVISIRRPPKAG